MSSDDFYHTIVIGGGQAGLAAGYFLSARGVNYAILDENQHMGETWRQRWETLRLFTPNHSNHLPGMKFPGPDRYFPTKDEAADYVTAYAHHFSLPVKNGFRVVELSRNQSGYHVSTTEGRLDTRNVIVATGAFHTSHIPALASELDRNLLQLHSSGYHNPGDVPVEKVLVVGAGNSGAEIALELAKLGKQVWLSGRDVGRIPADKLGKILGGKPYWWFLRNVMTIDTPLGRKMRQNVLTHGNPLICTQREDVAEAGVEFTPRLAGAHAGMPQTEDGKVLTVQGVVWATGFKSDYSWIRLPIFDGSGRPQHARGVVPEAPGLFFLGLHFQTGLTSSLLGGVGADAKYIVGKIADQE